jgi:hypothetical protein
MHLISDEIYGNSIFPHKVKDFKSVAQVPPVNRERVFQLPPTGPNQLDHRDNFSRSALRHESPNSLFQVSLYQPS